MGIRIDVDFGLMIGLAIGIERRGSGKHVHVIIVLPFMVLDIHKQ